MRAYEPVSLTIPISGPNSVPGRTGDDGLAFRLNGQNDITRSRPGREIPGQVKRRDLAHNFPTYLTDVCFAALALRLLFFSSPCSPGSESHVLALCNFCQLINFCCTLQFYRLCETGTEPRGDWTNATRCPRGFAVDRPAHMAWARRKTQFPDGGGGWIISIICLAAAGEYSS